MKRIKFAVIGMGFIWPRHKQAIESLGGEVYLTCDIDKTKNPDFTDWVEMFNHPKFKEVDIVSILTPNYLHAVIAREAVLKGKRVLCEKPLTLSSEECLTLSDNVFTVLQLRHHPEVIRLKNELKGKHKVGLVVKVKRDKDYWEGWKGQNEKSGGILFNLGIHYFDLLIHLFGKEYKVIDSLCLNRSAGGELDFNGTICNYYMEIMPDNKEQDRYLVIDGKRINLSKQDNLSFEDLHLEVYKDLMQGKGVLPSEAIKSIKLVEKLCR